MNIIIYGAGKTGQYLTRIMSAEGNDITLIESNPVICNRLRNLLDVSIIESQGIKKDVFNREFIGDCDLFIGVSSVDELNIFSCSAAKKVGAKKVVARVRNDDYDFMEDIIDLDHFGIDLIIHPEKELSKELVNLLKYPPAIDVYELYNGKIMLISTIVCKQSNIIGKSLGEIAKMYPLNYLRVVVIERGVKAIIPKGDFVVEENDKFFIVAEKKHLKDVFEMTGYKDERSRDIMIHGKGKLVETLGKELEKIGEFNIKIITSDENRAAHFSEVLTKSLIVCGEATDIDILAAEGIIETDFFLALTGNDETNIVSSLLANHLEVNKTITRIEKTDYLPITKTIGLSRCVNSSISTSNAIMRFVRHGKVLSSSTLKGTNVVMITFKVSSDSKYVDIPLAELQEKIPKDSIIGAIYRDGEPIVPAGNDVIKPEDEIIVFSEIDSLPKVEKMFG
ncbi:MAG: Trk system potassium transporter TrkA [Candidatus Aminicenantes bacterium]|nr:Trk system potassium transporter TrkA [Candidatus Aminicenantes bacterium]